MVLCRKPSFGKALRQFKRFDRQVCNLAGIPIADLQLQGDRALPVVEFLSLRRVLVGRDLAVHAQVQQRLQLRVDLLALTGQFLLLMLAVLLIHPVITLRDAFDDRSPDDHPRG
jgi:hypothetical protein